MIFLIAGAYIGGAAGVKLDDNKPASVFLIIAATTLIAHGWSIVL